METEADIQVPVCETRGDQVGNFVDSIINASVSILSLEKHSKDEQLHEHPTVGGENFLKPPSTGEVHSGVNNASPNVGKVTEEPNQAVEVAANKDISAAEVQQKGEEPSSTEKDEDTCTDSSVVISELKVEDKLDDGGVEVVTQLSNDTGSDNHGTNNSITENIVLAKEIIQETNLPSEETELQAPFIAEGEEKPTEEKVSCNVTSEVSKEEESEQCTMTTEQEVLANERGAGDNSSTAAEEVSQGSCTPTEIVVTPETSNNDEVQSKSDLNASFSKEEETTTQNGVKIGTTSEDSGVPLENTLCESHGDEECQSKSLEEDATDHGIPTLAEKKEEASLVQIYDSQKECEEHLEEKTEILPSTEVSMGDTNDIIPPATHNVKNKDEDITEAELSENEPSTTRLSVEEEKQIETPPEMLHVICEAEKATNDAVDGHKESLANPTIGEGNSEINNVATDLSEVTKELGQTVRDDTDNSLPGPKSDDQKVEFAAIEKTSVEEIQPNAEESNSIEKEGDGGAVPEQCNTDSLIMNSEVKVGDTLVDPIVDDIGAVTQFSKGTCIDQHGTDDSHTENITFNKEIIAETNILGEEIEFQTPCITEVDEVNVQVTTTDNKFQDKKTTEEYMSLDVRSEVSKEGESDQCKTTSKPDVLANERSVEDNTNTVAAEVSQNANAGLHRNTIEVEEAPTDGVDGQKESLESCTPVVSSSSKEESTSIVVQEITSDHMEDLENHLLGEAHTETTSVEPDLIEVTKEPDQIMRDGSDILFPGSKSDDQKEEFSDNEETSIEEIQPNAEDSISKEKEGDRGGVPEECSNDSLVITSEVKAGDTHDDPGVDDTKVVMQQSKDTSIDQHGANDLLTENISLTTETLEETNISSEENESQAPCITEGEELNVQVKTIDKEYADDITTKEDTSHDLKGEVSKEDEADQNKTASEQDALANERSVEDNSEAEEVNQDDSTSTKTIPTLETSNSDELQSKCESNSSLSKEEEITVEKGDRSVAASETLEDPATDHSYPNLTEKSKESSLVQIEDSKTECDEHLEEESEKLLLNEVSTGATNDNIPPVTDSVKERDEDLKEAELLENEPSTRCTSVEEDRQIETHAESLLVTPEDIEVSTLSQETECDEHLEEESEKLPSKEVITGATDDKIPPVTDVVKERDEDLKEVELSENKPGTRCNSVEEYRQIETHAKSLLVAPEAIEVSTLSQENSIKGPTQEQSSDTALHGSINEVEEATIYTDDQQKESFESFPPIISSSAKEGSMNAVQQEDKSDHADEKIIDEVDKHAEDIENLTIGEPHSQRNKVALEISEVAEKPDQSVEFAADEEIQQNAEESNITEKDGDRGVEPEQCNTDSLVVTSEVKVRDTHDDLDVDDAMVVTQISKDTSSNEHGTNDSFTETSSLKKEILHETNIPSEEIESQVPCITEDDGLNVQVNTIGDKYQDEKPTEEDKSCNVISEVSKEAESDQNETTSEQEVFANEKSAAEGVSQENSASTGTITTLETSASNEHQSNSDFTSSLSKEDETTVLKADESLTTSDNLSKNHGDIECQPKTLEDAATDHSNLKLAEKSEERSLDQIEDSQLECEEHLEVESERLPLTEASTGGTNDNASEAIDKVKDEGEDVKEVELSENEQSTRCTFVKEDVHIEQKATISEFDDQQKESLESSPPIVSSSPEEGSMDATSKEVTGDHKDDIVEEVDKHKEVLENHSTTKDTKGNSSITLEGSDNQNEDDIGKESERAFLPLPLAREVGEEMLNTEDSLNISEDNKTPDLSQEIKTGSVIEEKDLTTHPQGILDKRSDGGTVDETEAKEDTLENVATEIPHEHIEENSVTQLDCSKKKEEEHLEKEEQKPSTIDATIEEVNSRDWDSREISSDNTKREPKDEVDTNEESLEAKGIAESLDCDKDPANDEDDSRKHIEHNLIKEEESIESLKTSDNLSENHGDGVIECQPKTLENAATDHSNLKLAEKSEESSLDQIEDSQLECEEHLEVESERLPLTEASIGGTTDNASEAIDKVKGEGGDVKEVDLSENEQSTRCTLLKEDVQIEQEATISEFDGQQKESLESSPPIVSSSPEEGSMDTASKEVTGDHKDDIVEEVDKYKEVLENHSTTGSTEDTEGNSSITLEGSENQKEDYIGKQSVKEHLPLPLAKEVSEELLNTKDSLNITSEDNRTLDLSQEIKTGSVIEEQDLTTHPQGTLDKRSDGGTVDEIEAKEDTLENVATEIPHEHIEENSVTQVDCSKKKEEEHLEKDEQMSSLIDATKEEVNSGDQESREISSDNTNREPIDEVDTNEESLEAKGIAESSLDCDKYPANDEDDSRKHIEHNLIKEEESIESLQVTAKDIEATSLGENTETSCQDEQSTNANSEATMDGKKENISASDSGLEDETPKIIANTTQYEDKEENLQLQEDCSKLEQIEDLGNDSESKHFIESPRDYTIESGLVKEAEKVEKPVEEQIITSDPQEICDKTQENTVDTSDKKDDAVVNVQNGDNGDSSSVEPDSSQNPSSEEALAEAINGVEPTDVNETTFVNENAANANLFEEKKIESTLAKEEVCIESLQVGDEDIKANSSVQDREATQLDEQATTTDSQDHKDETTIHLADVKEKFVLDKDIAKSVPSEKDSPNVAEGSQKPSLEEGLVENIDEHESTTMHAVKFVDESLIKADLMENEENTEVKLIKEDVSIESPQVAAEDLKEPCLNEVRETNSQEEQILSADPRGLIDDNKTIDPTDFQKETPKDEVSSEELESVEKSPKVTAEEIPSAEDLDVNENIIGKIHEVSNYKQQEPSITEVSEESMTASNEHASDNTSLESEVSEKKNNQVVGEANTCDDKIDLEKVEVSNDGPIAVPTYETPTETDLRGSTEAEVQVPSQEKDTELSLHNSSECISELEGANSEAQIDSNSCEEISGTSNSAAMEENLTSNSSQEPRREIREETETEEHKKQDMGRDAQPCLESANDFDITDDVQNLKEAPLPAEEERLIETPDCKESGVVEGASKDMDIGHLEQNDSTKSFSDDKKSTEEVLEETVANDILQVSPSETSGGDHCATEREVTNSENPCTEKTALGDDEKLACDEKISYVSYATPHTTQTIDADVVKLTNDTDNRIDNAEGQMVNDNTSGENLIVNERSATYLESKNDDEAPEIKETTPSAAECKDLASTNLEETSNYPCSLTEEKSNSDEVAFAPGENKSRYESKNQVIETIPVAENILQQEETMCEKEILKNNISSETEQIPRIKEEDGGAKDYEHGSCKEDVIGDSHQEDEIKQEHQSITKETTNFIEDGSQTETVSKLSEEVIDKAPEEQEEKTLTNETIDEVLQQEERAKSIEEAVPIATIPDNESDKQNCEDEICSLYIVQAKDEENIMEKSEQEAKEDNTWTKPIEDEDKKASIEAKELDCASQTEGISKCAVGDGACIPEDNDVSTTKNTFSEEDYPSKSIVAEASTGSEDVALTKLASEDTNVTAEVQEAKAGIDLGAAIPKSTEIESREVEELNEKCAVKEGTSTPAEPPVISTSKVIPEWTVGTPLEVEDQQIKFHDLPEDLNIKDSQVKISEKDDIVKLQSVGDISKDVQELSKISFEVSNNQNAPVSEIPERETEEKQLGCTEDVNDTEYSINQSSVADTVQHEKTEGSQQVDSPHSLPQAQCSDIKRSEKDLIVHVQGLNSVDVAELEAVPLPLKDKHDVLEADDAKNLNHEIEKSSKVEREVNCVNEERLDQEMEGKPESNEIGKSSLSDLFLVSKRESTQIADHSATKKEPTSHTKDLRAENSDEAEHENSKTDEEKDDEDESHEQQKSDSISEAPVMVDVGDADVKVAHKKSHNILSGVGSKVKHSIAKVKKAITGKSSHPKPPSPKKVTN